MERGKSRGKRVEGDKESPVKEWTSGGFSGHRKTVFSWDKWEKRKNTKRTRKSWETSRKGGLKERGKLGDSCTSWRRGGKGYAEGGRGGGGGRSLLLKTR